MNYELAKKLKDAGFPFDWCRLAGTGSHKFCDADNCEPTLSELIEACGTDHNGTYFRWLKYEFVQWHAQARRHPASLGDVRAKGKTPEEAVANLWLALNDNKEPK